MLSGTERRERLRDARLMLVFTPEVAAAAGSDPLEALARALGVPTEPLVDVVQVRAKALAPAPPEGPEGPGGPVGPEQAGPDTGGTSARAALDWTRRVLELRGDRRFLVLVNDRVDVARALAAEGCDGVHLGQDDAPPASARELLGAEALIGLSTHDAGQVARAGEAPVDYLGLGPVFPTATKGYGQGLGPELAWIADRASALPVFPIGGIDATNAGELDAVGRAAVSSSVLAANDPAAAARTLRAALTE